MTPPHNDTEVDRRVAKAPAEIVHAEVDVTPA